MNRSDANDPRADTPARGRLCMIGGGPAATAMLTHLAERLAIRRDTACPRTVTIIEKTGHFGVGRPWSDAFALPQHLSSLPGGASRSAYGHEQSARVRKLRAHLEEFGVAVELISASEVVDVERSGECFRLRLADESCLDTQFAVLATGHWDAADNAASGAGFAAPWPAAALQRRLQASVAESQLQILILGTYLTGVDSVVTAAHALGRFVPKPGRRFIYASPHEFRITLASRRARLPSVWSRDYAPYRSKYFDLDAIEATIATAGRVTLQDLYTLLRQELDAARLLHYSRAIAENSSVDQLVRFLEERPRVAPAAQLARRFRLALGSGDPESSVEPGEFRRFQALLFDTLHVLSETWHRLSAEDRGCFDAQLRGPYFCHAMPMPPETAAKLLALLDAGRLDLLRLGHEYRLEPGNDAQASLLIPGAGARKFGSVVDARGQSGDIREHPSRLFANLRNRGELQTALARSATAEKSSATPAVYRPTGGVYVNPRSCEVIPLGHQNEKFVSPGTQALFAMGPNLLGQFLDAQSRGQLDRDAARILADVGRRIAAARSPTDSGHRDHAPT